MTLVFPQPCSCRKREKTFSGIPVHNFAHERWSCLLGEHVESGILLFWHLHLQWRNRAGLTIWAYLVAACSTKQTKQSKELSERYLERNKGIRVTELQQYYTETKSGWDMNLLKMLFVRVKKWLPFINLIYVTLQQQLFKWERVVSLGFIGCSVQISASPVKN